MTEGGIVQKTENKSLEEYELVFDNPLYEPDVSKRELVSLM